MFMFERRFSWKLENNDGREFGIDVLKFKKLIRLSLILQSSIHNLWALMKYNDVFSWRISDTCHKEE